MMYWQKWILSSINNYDVLTKMSIVKHKQLWLKKEYTQAYQNIMQVQI